MHLTIASTRFATFGILGFFEFSVLSGKFKLNLHSSKRVMQALCAFLLCEAYIFFSIEVEHILLIVKGIILIFGCY
ncbi:hypothetical protein A6E03_19100 [Aliivibrio sp. 1S128]|nr:hypothetical protein A6E03_19100 [Aliivibrio sp. 1S128]